MPRSSHAANSPAWTIRPGRADDADAIAVLLHRTFVEELGQYAPAGNGRHVDKFHHRNRYFVAEHGGELIGLVALNASAPFSVADRLPQDGPSMAELADRPLEIRLWCVARAWRGSALSFRLMAAVHQAALEDGYRELWISAVEDQLPLYRRLGFRALGPAVAQGDTQFTPMRLRLDELPPRLVQRARGPLQAAPDLHPLLPGPPYLADEVVQAASGRSVYHRDGSFLAAYRRTRRLLAQHFHGMEVALFPGGGTTANDAVAQALAHLPAAEAPGIVLHNGEFGQRLLAHARGVGLEVEAFDGGWGQAWPMARLAQRLAQGPPPPFLWGVQVESSTGMHNPVAKLLALRHEAGLDDRTLIAIDAASSLGPLPLPEGVDLVASVSGKGLEAKAGIALVAIRTAWRERLSPAPWPPSLDLETHWRAETPPHTLDGCLLAALDASLRGRLHPADQAAHIAREAARGKWVRQQLRACGAELLIDEADASPCLQTFRVPQGLSTAAFLEQARRWGFLLAGASRYLAQRRLAQLATFGPHPAAALERFFAQWRAWQGQGREQMREQEAI